MLYGYDNKTFKYDGDVRNCYCIRWIGFINKRGRLAETIAFAKKNLV